MSEWDRQYQTHNYSAPCPNCGGYAVVEPNAQCWRCEENLSPGCPHCRMTLAIDKTLESGMCPRCGELVKSFVLVRASTVTRA